MTAALTADVAIVGGGIIGLASAERLTAHGARVIVIDDTAAAGGATGVSGGLVRAFDPSGTHTAWAAESSIRYRSRGWHGSWPAVRRHGSLTLIDRRELAALTPHIEAVRDAGLEIDVLDAGDIERRHPQLTVPDHLLAVAEPQAGWLPAADVALALRRDAGAGLHLHHTRALGLKHSSSRVRGVHTSGGDVHADAVLLAAGTGSTDLAASVGVRLPLRTRAVSYCLFHSDDIAGLPTTVDRTTGAWLRRWENGHAVLAGVASARADVPARIRDGVGRAEEDRIRTVVAERFPHLAHAPAVGGVTAYDAMTATGGPGTVTSWPDPHGLVTAVGWNGGGFKLAPAIGRQAADHLMEALKR
ncbi:NAD(P)/FAD-dependent oxidoreductase [Streptomyces beigongshangae]|uniref:NAD(P)/FAD-dependent oxidoreductase n=1 Tax=Streptomyces beigongshangae TaxID=2841597 RepID=UPI001C863A17|nr:FAD-dependent oxidoreductase [Streptomyces sp. REN17]